jgi:hypothetical protein
LPLFNLFCMKQALATLCTIFIFLSASAQTADSTNNKLKETTAALKEKAGGSRDRIVVELTFDNWIHNEDSLKVKWYSRGFNAYFMYDIQLGKKKLFAVAPGLGIGTSSIFTNSKLVEGVDSLGGGTRMVERTDSYKKNKLGLTYLDIPVELRFRSKPNSKNKSFKVAVGFKAGFLLDGKTKVKQKDADGNMKVYKEKRYDDLNRFRYGATFRIGYGPFSVIGYYSLAKIFEKGKGPSITPFSVGIAINGL